MTWTTFENECNPNNSITHANNAAKLIINICQMNALE